MKEKEDIIFFRIMEEITPPGALIWADGKEFMEPTPELLDLAGGAMETIMNIGQRNGVLLERVFGRLAEIERQNIPQGEDLLQAVKVHYEKYMELASRSSEIGHTKAECYFLSMAATHAMYEVGHLPYPENVEYSQKVLVDMFVKAEFGSKYNVLLYGSHLD